MGGGGNEQVSKSEPSDYTKGYLTPGLDEAKSLFAEGPAKFYEGSTVPTDVLAAIKYRGMQGDDARLSSQHALNMMSDGGMMDTSALDTLRNLGLSNGFTSNPAVTNLGSMATAGPGTADRLLGRTGDIIATGGNNLATFRSDVGDIISGQATGANPALAGLGLTASGAYLNSNPYLDDTFNKAADKVTRQFRTATSPTLDGRFALSSGAATSGAAENARDQVQENLGDTLSGLATSVYGGAYDAERARQEAAKAAQGAQYLQGLGLRTSAAATSAGTGVSDTQNRLAASTAVTGAESDDAAKKLAANAQIGSLYESGADRQIQATKAANDVYNTGRAQQLQALGLQPAYQQMDYNDLNAALGAEQQGINADIARWDYEQNAPWANLQRYMSMVTGGAPGTSTSITNSGGSPLGTGLAAAGGMGQLAIALKSLGLF